ncbi:deoxynucleoside kinase-like [Neocloeon triangulifer]|uniref:deoxynucleoside kinase-like n=1 Tax=Neocloeon triangulifer TaxID=2078957 RepID=UPI00286F77AB|nr:deoxynucleoside kinase-like [Neocloeon triangulifer]
MIISFWRVNMHCVVRRYGRVLTSRLCRTFSSMTSKPNRPFTVVVEGNIGSGKTTFLNQFKRMPEVIALAEPVEMWRDANGHNLLDLMYEDPSKYSMAFQSYVQLTMLEMHQANFDVPIKVMERSIHSARHCFVENLYNSGFLASVNRAVLDEWYKWICNTQDVNADLIVYLYTTPETAFERIQHRNRNEEKKISMSYLKTLHDLHEHFIRSGLTKRFCKAPVIEIDANKDLSELSAKFDECRERIMKSSVNNDNQLLELETLQ